MTRAEIQAQIDQGWLGYVRGWATTLVAWGWLPAEAMDDLDRVEAVLPVVAEELIEPETRPLTREQHARAIWATVAELQATGEVDEQSSGDPRILQ